MSNVSSDFPLRGIFTPNITPTTSNGEFDEPTLRRYIDWLIDQGIHGLYPNGSTGEFLRFTAQERKVIMKAVVDQVGGRIPILAGAAEENVYETLRTCEAYAEMGVTAVAIVAPFYFPVSEQGVEAYFEAIAKSAPLPVTLYNIPQFASPISVRVVQHLAENYASVVGIKDSSGDLPHMMRMIQAIRPKRPDFTFLTGWDASLAAMLMMGCDGGTNATSGVVPKLTKHIYDSVRSGDFAVATTSQLELLPLFDAMVSMQEFPEGFRQAARLVGWDFGQSRQPITAEQASTNREAISKIQHLLSALAEKGLAEFL